MGQEVFSDFIVIRRLYVNEMFVNSGELNGFLNRRSVGQELDPSVNDGKFLRDQPSGRSVLKLVGDVGELRVEIKTERSEEFEGSINVILLQLPPDRVKLGIERGV